jgi:SAM-dependent methyltransferase
VARRRTPEAERAGVIATLEDEVHQVCFVEGHYPDGWPRHERCPCCESSQTRYLFSKQDLAHSLCGACGFVFLDPYPTDALLDRIYNAAYYPGVRRFVELPKARAGQPAALFSFPEPVLERIIEHVRHPARPGTWLEVGGGVGAFAHLAQARLPDWQVHLNELNRDAVAFARDAYGLRTIEGGPDVIAASGMQFDVISMIATLEHVPQPYELLSAFAPLLRPGGYLVIGVPRFSPLNRAISHDASASVTPPYHVSHFDERNLALLLRRIDLLDDADLVAWQDGPNAFKLIDLVKTWPYWRIEVPTTELDAPRSGMLEPYPEPMRRWVNALGAADELTGDLIHEIDGGLFLTVIARRRGEATSG